MYSGKLRFVLTLSLLAGALAATAQEESGDAALQRLLRQALVQSSEIRAAQARLGSAMAMVPQARALPNPEIVLETMGTDAVGAEQSVSLVQAFPWPGTLSRRESAANFQARALWHEVEAMELATIAQVRALVAGYVYLRNEAEVIGRTLKLYRKQEESLEQVARAGGSLPNLLRLEMETGMLTDELAMVEEAMARELAALEAVVGGPIPSDILEGLKLSRSENKERNVGTLLQALPLRNPTLKALESRVEAAREGVEVARMETYPEFMVGAGYRRVVEPGMGGTRESMNEAMLMVSVSVPLWERKNRAIRDGAGSMLELARQDYESALRMSRAQLNVLLSRVRDAQRRVILFGDTLLPKAEQAHDALEAAYRAGSVSIIELFDARRRLLEMETSYWRALADLEIYEAELDGLFGTEVGSQGMGKSVNEL